VEGSKLCLFSVIMPAKCVSSISPRFHYRRVAFCFLPLAAILESPYFNFKMDKFLLYKFYPNKNGTELSRHLNPMLARLQCTLPVFSLQFPWGKCKHTNRKRRHHNFTGLPSFIYQVNLQIMYPEEWNFFSLPKKCRIWNKKHF
jgi:hypothetical protein